MGQSYRNGYRKGSTTEEPFTFTRENGSIQLVLTLVENGEVRRSDNAQTGLAKRDQMFAARGLEYRQVRGYETITVPQQHESTYSVSGVSGKSGPIVVTFTFNYRASDWMEMNGISKMQPNAPPLPISVWNSREYDSQHGEEWPASRKPEISLEKCPTGNQETRRLLYQISSQGTAFLPPDPVCWKLEVTTPCLIFCREPNSVAGSVSLVRKATRLAHEIHSWYLNDLGVDLRLLWIFRRHLWRDAPIPAKSGGTRLGQITAAIRNVDVVGRRVRGHPSFVRFRNTSCRNAEVTGNFMYVLRCV